MKMTIERREDGITGITLDGRFDLQGAKEIDQKLVDATSTGTAAVVIDLSLVSFIGSIGIHALIAAARSQSARGGRVVLVRPEPMVGKVLEISGLDKMVPVYDDLEAALRALRMLP
jgi:stage II sporulation protein AA (anti-sigma F factor antagonist)